uniref:transposase n=1 Tax=Sphaerospermopsis aphanizomenoides TaxID=459663 RepID=UPI002D811658|nr:transposase [Sphaerospermopsis aphanizomenoides]
MAIANLKSPNDHFSLCDSLGCGRWDENRWRIIAMEIMPDHVHLFINAKPTDNPSQIMNRIKGRASHFLRKEFPELLKLPPAIV